MAAYLVLSLALLATVGAQQVDLIQDEVAANQFVEDQFIEEPQPVIRQSQPVRRQQQPVSRQQDQFVEEAPREEHFQTDPASFVDNQGNFQCPHESGFYPHHIACDQYWKCENSVPILKQCGNGLAFQDTDPDYLKEECDYIYNVQCGERHELEPPIPTEHCDYQHGVFPDFTSCSVFYSCWAGEATKYDCGPGLAYDRTSRICTWKDQVDECAQQRADENELAGIACPAPGVASVVGAFSRHAHNDDCRQFFVCFDGVPRQYGCPIGKVFQIGSAEGTGECTDPELVPGCEDYYGEADIISLKTQGL